MKPEIKSFRNIIEEGSRTGAMKDATTLVTMEIEIVCQSLDHATRTVKQVTSSVEKVINPDPLAERGI